MDAGWGLEITVLITLTKHLVYVRLKLCNLIPTTALRGRYHHYSLFTDEEPETKANLPTVTERIEPGSEPRESDNKVRPCNHTFVSPENSYRRQNDKVHGESYLLDSSKLFTQLFQLVSYLLHRLLQIFQLLYFNFFLWTVLKCLRIK